MAKTKAKPSTNGSVNRIKDLVDKPVVIAAPNMMVATFRIYGTAPYVQNAFSHKTATQMLQAQQATKATSRKKKDPRDIEADFQGAMHKTEKGSYGIPAGAFRAAMISACRVAGFQMTKAKLSVFVVADGLDAADGTPLVHFDAGEPEMNKMHVRLESGVASIAIRPMWREWSCELKCKWDGDQFSSQDVANLLERAGQQVGIGEGRPDSKKSCGMGWGTFTLIEP